MTGPLYGGIDNNNVTLGDTGDQGTDPNGQSSASGMVWFDPITWYCEQEGVSHSDCAFFCRACEGILGPTLVNPNELQGTAPQYPPFTPSNIEALGVCQIFMQWVYSAWWSQQTGQQEGAPPAPGSGPGNGGGIWG